MGSLCIFGLYGAIEMLLLLLLQTNYVKGKFSENLTVKHQLTKDQ